MMLTISWQMTLVAVLILPVSFGLIGLVIGQVAAILQEQQVSLGHLNGHVEEMFSGHMVMQAFGGERAIGRQVPRHQRRSCTRPPGNRSSSPG